MTHPIFKSMFWLVLLLGFTFSFPFPIFSDSIRFHLGYWAGKYQPELEKRLRIDDLSDFTSDGIYKSNEKWTGGNSSFFPLGISYFRDYSKWTLVTRFNYFHRSFNYNYSSIDSRFNFSDTTLSHGFSSDYELDFGFRKGIWNDRIFLTPRLGARSHIKNFDLVEATFGVDTLLVSTNGRFRSYSNQVYPGLEIQFYLNKKASLLFDGVFPFSQSMDPIGRNGDLTSKMDFDLDRAGAYTNRSFFERNRVNSDYIYQLTRVSLALEYSLIDEIALQVGFREERTDTRYENLKNDPYRIANGGAGAGFSPTPTFQYLLLERIADRLFYADTVTSIQRGIFASVTYKISL